MTSRTYWPIPEDWNALSSVERKALISGMPEWVYGTEVHRMGQARWVETWEPWRIFELLYGKDEPRPWEFTPGEGWRNWEFGQVKFAKPKAEPQLDGVEIGVLRKMREGGTGPQGKLKEVLDRRKQVTSGGGGNIPADFTSTGIGFGEIRTTSSTGGQKGVKPAKYSLLPPEAMSAIAEHFGVGAQKYSDHQWRKGYEWSKSFDAMQRHAWAFWGGEDLDPETGTPHMAAVEFHAMVLLTFMSTHRDFDDRPKDTE